MIFCDNDRRKHGRRASDNPSKWKVFVAMGLLFIGWTSLVYLHWLVTKTI